VPALTPEEKEKYDRDKIFFPKEAVRFPRQFLPLSDPLHQLVLLILRDGNGAWQREIPVETIERARSILRELTLHQNGPGGLQALEAVLRPASPPPAAPAATAALAATARKPLSDQAREMYDLLCSLPETEGRRAKQLVQELQSKFAGINEDRIRKLAQELEPYGIDRTGAAGYFIPLDRRPNPPRT
jgi:hypothetical protein